MTKVIVKTIIILVSFILAGFVQASILNLGSASYIYLGKSLAVWGVAWYTLATSMISTCSYLFFTK